MKDGAVGSPLLSGQNLDRLDFLECSAEVESAGDGLRRERGRPTYKISV